MYHNVKSNFGGNSMLLKGYLTVRQVAKELGLTEYRIRQLIREKQIRATKIGQWRIKPDDLKNFIKSRSNV
jgi:excisionase family DNA binding protein